MPRTPCLTTRVILGLALTATLTGHARAQAASAPARAASDASLFVATDSTLVVLVPTGVSATSVLGAVRAVHGREVRAVYTSDDAGAGRLAGALADAVGASLIPYDRVGATPAAYAATLLHNAVGANPRGTVMVVAPPELTDALFRAAAAASGVAAPADAHAGGRTNGVVVLAVAPHTPSLVRARF